MATNDEMMRNGRRNRQNSVRSQLREQAFHKTCCKACGEPLNKKGAHFYQTNPGHDDISPMALRAWLAEGVGADEACELAVIRNVCFHL